MYQSIENIVFFPTTSVIDYQSIKVIEIVWQFVY